MFLFTILIIIGIFAILGYMRKFVNIRIFSILTGIFVGILFSKTVAVKLFMFLHTPIIAHILAFVILFFLTLIIVKSLGNSLSQFFGYGWIRNTARLFMGIVQGLIIVFLIFYFLSLLLPSGKGMKNFPIKSSNYSAIKKSFSKNFRNEVKDDYIAIGDRKKDRFDKEIIRTARMCSLDPFLLKALVATESNFNPRAVSNVGAKGLTQLMPETAEIFGVKDPFDPDENLRGGAKHLSNLIKRHKLVPVALAYYYSGSYWKKRPYIAMPYVFKVLWKYYHFKWKRLCLKIKRK